MICKNRRFFGLIYKLNETNKTFNVLKILNINFLQICKRSQSSIRFFSVGNPLAVVNPKKRPRTSKKD